MTYKELGQKALGLPEEPGVYLMKNKEGKILYVGKAIVLRRRVYSYFSAPEKHTPKTAALVSHIFDFDVIVAKSELEALLLENNLIKKNKPPYNILLKDDKGYPFLRLTAGDYPRLELSHKAEGKGEFFGPFYGARSAGAVKEAADRAFLLPTCRDPGPRPGRRPCLNARIGRCMAPCGGKVSRAEYDEAIAGVRAFLRGDVDEILEQTRLEMERASERLEFERAARLRDRMRAIVTLGEKQRVAKEQAPDADYLAVFRGEGKLCACLLHTEGGLLLDKAALLVGEDAAENEAALLGEYIRAYYGQDGARIPGRVLASPAPADRALLEEYLTALRGRRVHLMEPRRSEDRALCEMARRNAQEELIQKTGKTRAEERARVELGQLMGGKAPDRIEIYDISHEAGRDVVCGMAVYGENGFCRDRYRKFRLAAPGGDDCACLKEAVLRRVRRAKEGDEAFLPLPDAIFADGALAQVRAVREALAEEGVDLPVYGLKKDNRHRTRAFVFEDGREVLLYKYPLAFPLCGRMQEEAHRFAVAYHTAAAKKRSLESLLTPVPGIGEKTAAALLKRFGSLRRVRDASPEELCAVRGVTMERAQALREHLRSVLPN